MARPSQVPGEAEWAGYEDDLDVRYAYRLYFGKTTDEVKYDFRDLVIERGDIHGDFRELSVALATLCGQASAPG